MATSTQSATGIWPVEPHPLTAEDPALRVVTAGSTIFVLPDRVEGGWRGWRRTSPTDLEAIVIGCDRARDLADRDHAEIVDVDQTPAWVEAASVNPTA